jgi:N-acyl-D-amino-acid deacylase
MRQAIFIPLLLGIGLSCAPAFAAAPANGVQTRMVERDGRMIAFHVIAGKLPAIVLDAGGGEDSSHWSTLAPELAKQTGAEVITYDRAGEGESSEAPGPWSLESATEDLEAGLRTLGATHDTVLVPHSLAGEIATDIVGEHPDWFGGAVLLDANVPEFFTEKNIEYAMRLYAPRIAALRKTPPTTPGGRQLLALSESYVPVSRAFHRLTWPASVPVTVIVSQKTPLPDKAGAQSWRDAEAAFAEKAANRSLIVAAGSSHDVVHDRPDVVLKAIIAMWKQAKAASADTAAVTYDVVIRNGRVLDGSGNPWVHADVAIKDGRFVKIGLVKGRGIREIDAKGLYVTPGWIDAMDQSGKALLEHGRGESKLRQGVTTAIAGESGAPVGSAKLAEYFDQLQRQGISLNFGTLYGATQARIEVMGDVDGVPTPSQLEKERAHVAEAMRAGALGIGTALAYEPAGFQKTPELIALAKVAHKYGGIYANHMRSESKNELSALRESIEIGEQSGAPIQIYHLKVAYAPGWGKFMPAIGKLIDDARARGVDISADMYPYRAAGTGLDITVPKWVWAEGKKKGLERLADPALRAKLKKDAAADGLIAGIGGWGHVVLADPYDAKYDRFRFESIAAIGKQLKRDPADVAWDIIVAAQPHRASALYFAMSEEDIETALRFPWTSIGSDSGVVSDGQQHVGGHPRGFGTFPRIVAEYVRDRHLLTLPDAIRKMTSWPAAQFRLFDRGAIRVGLRADVTIFDYDKIQDMATYRNPSALPQGIDYVLVNGTIVIDGGRYTGARPGMVLRGQGWTGSK